MNKTLEAIAKVQAELGYTLHSDSQGQYGSYVSLETVLKAVMPIAQKHGLVITQYQSLDGDKPVLHTSIAHNECDEEVLACNLLTPDKAGPQGMGAAETYARRRALMAIFGLASEGDPDQAPNSPGFANKRPTNDSRGSNKGFNERSTQAPISQPGLKSGHPSNASNPQNPSLGRGAPDAGGYVIKFGKHQNKTMAEVGLRDVRNYAEWLQKNAQAKNEALSSGAREFCEAAERFEQEMMDRANQEMTGFAQDVKDAFEK